MTYQKERSIAVEAVTLAARVCRAVRQEAPEAAAKQDRSPVTIADYGAQAVVSALLNRQFPNDPLVAEEDTSGLVSEAGAAMRSKVIGYVQSVTPEADPEDVLHAIGRGGWHGGRAGRFWTLDPIDGTKGFLRNDQYAVALALIEDGRVELGALACPSLPLVYGEDADECGCLFVAVRGQGAVMRRLGHETEEPIRVSDIADAASARFCESVESGHSSHGDSARIAQLLGVTESPVRMDSQCKYGAVARGDAAIYLRMPVSASYVEKIWDHAAGAIIVQEAGGKVTDIHGRPLDFSLGRTLSSNSGVVATNGRLHDSVITAIHAVVG
ncbi:MAG TPA: 3'(2'),5'-bisphosphate nucleotidase [Chthonomonadales bacterium]|nr:3'(2'),5'-bisphosphate nucleotidase [Chthonomonadales bacterium]